MITRTNQRNTDKKATKKTHSYRIHTNDTWRLVLLQI